MFTYDNRIGVLRNKQKRNKAKVGEIAGVKINGGYRQVRIGGIRYVMHRLIWVYHNGDIPKGMIIDHINHNPEDSRIENLRLATITANNRNARRSKANRSGVTGVYWVKKEKKWFAAAKNNNRNTFWGAYDKFEDAVLARSLASKKLGYHPNHGMPRQEGSPQCPTPK